VLKSIIETFIEDDCVNRFIWYIDIVNKI
jgi:hypothetical protein